MPLPNTKAVPAGWSTHHAPVAAGGMNGKVRIYDPATATPGWDDATESATLDRGVAVYDGPCRIQAQDDARSVVQADDPESVRGYLIQVLFDAPDVEQGWTAVPYEVLNDPSLNGAEMVVGDVEHGTERFTRDLFCTLAK